MGNRGRLFGVAALVLIGLTGCGNADKPTQVKTTSTVDVQPGCGTQGLCGAPTVPSTQPVPNNELVQGSVIGQVLLHDGDNKFGGNGQDVDGIKAQGDMDNGYHIHSHLSLFVNGKQVAIPRGIGVLGAKPPKDGIVDGDEYYWLHTHDATGIIHVEAPKPGNYTLGQFFDIWGEPLSTNNVAGFTGPVHAFVNGQPYTGKLADVPLASHSLITLEVGSKTVTPPVYLFPKGL